MIFFFTGMSVPVVTVSQNQKAKVGSAVKFHCKASAAYDKEKPQLEVKWLHVFINGDTAKKINDSSYKNTKKDVNKTERILSILTVKVSQTSGGTYLCEASVKHGKGGVFKYLQNTTLSG